MRLVAHGQRIGGGIARQVTAVGSIVVHAYEQLAVAVVDGNPTFIIYGTTVAHPLHILEGSIQSPYLIDHYILSRTHGGGAHQVADGKVDSLSLAVIHKE